MPQIFRDFREIEVEVYMAACPVRGVDTAREVWAGVRVLARESAGQHREKVFL